MEEIISQVVSGIYRIYCTKSGKSYIGQSINVSGRVLGHFRKLRLGTHQNKHLQNAFNLYGESSFGVEVLEYCNESSLTRREQHWIDRYGFGNLYNIAPVAGSTAGCKYSEEMGRKTSERLKKQWASAHMKDGVIPPTEWAEAFFNNNDDEFWSSNDLYHSYLNHAAECDGTPMSKYDFGHWLNQYGVIQATRRINGKVCRVKVRKSQEKVKNVAKEVCDYKEQINEWVKKNVTAAPGNFMTNESAYASYVEYAKQLGSEPTSSINFGRILSSQVEVIGSQKRIDGKVHRGYRDFDCVYTS